MAADGLAQTGDAAPHGYWRGVTCSADDCDRPVSCKGLCTTHYNKARWAAGHRPPSINPAARRAARIKHRYGITVEDYDRMLAEQEGLCAICEQVPADGPAHWGGKLCVDHDHETGAVRGLLCNDCNLLIKRHFTPSRLHAAAEYLERHA